MVTEEVIEQNGHAQQGLTASQEEALTSNLTLLMPPRVEVDFMEHDEVVDPSTGETTIVDRIRRASISSYVPMSTFHQMLAGRSKLLKAKGDDMADNLDDLMAWMRDAVFQVWKRSEPKMTIERFADGLQMDQIMELFQRFFGELMRRLGERGRFMQSLNQPR